MANIIAPNIPTAELQRLEFMVGEFVGTETLYPPEGSPVHFIANVSGHREACERFVKIDFFGDIPDIGIETFRAMATYSVERETYRLWLFSATQEEPIHMEGGFEDERLVLLSDPTPMVWGIQRLRYTLTPHADGSYDLLGERWEPDGYAKYCTVTFRRMHELEGM